MRSSKSRSRNKSNRQRTLGNIVNRVFDSSGPEGKVRGTPQQIIEKYLTLARDAQLSGDRVAEQAFFQHAEHYTRMLGEAQKEMADRQPAHQGRAEGDDGRDSQPSGVNGHPQREAGGRDDHRRDEARRDQAGRENGLREGRDGRDPQRDQPFRDQSPRDLVGREQAPREQPPREQAGREQALREPAGREQPRLDVAPRSEGLRRDDLRPAAEPEVTLEPDARAEPSAPGLPDARATQDDQSAGPVETPEATVRPSRSRSPRVPRAEKPAAARSPRARRKPSESDARPEDLPAQGEE